MADDKNDYLQQRLDTISDKVSDTNSTLKTHITKFDNLLDWTAQAREDIRQTHEVLQKNTASLEVHIYRTQLLEDYVKKVDARFAPVEVEHLRVKAVNEWVSSKLKLIAKFGAAAGALGTLSVLAKYLLQIFIK